jgi:pre-mRNA cleavage complex 2 protein Pcf11
VDVGDKGSVGRLRRPLNAKAAAAAEVAKREAELRAQYVVVPSGDEAKPHSCPICKEPMIPEFLEDDEEWVWKNAVRKDDKVCYSTPSPTIDLYAQPKLYQIYHATCHAEAVTSTTSLAARLRNEINGRSRSQTPEARVSRSPPAVGRSPLPSKVVGAKRKAEDEPTPGVKVESDRSPPPMKKSIKSPPSE